jgi:hypothetical protein
LGDRSAEHRTLKIVTLIKLQILMCILASHSKDPAEADMHSLPVEQLDAWYVLLGECEGIIRCVAQSKKGMSLITENQKTQGVERLEQRKVHLESFDL